MLYYRSKGGESYFKYQLQPYISITVLILHVTSTDPTQDGT
jgi:hypothetical protein